MTHQFLTNHKQYYKGCQLRRPFGLVGLSNHDEQVLEQCNVHSWQKNAVKERLYKIETINVKTTCTELLAKLLTSNLFDFNLEKINGNNQHFIPGYIQNFTIIGR